MTYVEVSTTGVEEASRAFLKFFMATRRGGICRENDPPDFFRPFQGFRGEKSGLVLQRLAGRIIEGRIIMILPSMILPVFMRVCS
ncbi:MAG: hypothetical protein NTX50_20135, partial [Candidatus Sumerlaeota bacterium]|nr:hypothetical protein [Candidatus Sumerlaeota bacterium]